MCRMRIGTFKKLWPGQKILRSLFLAAQNVYLFQQSMRTPEKTINLANEHFGKENIVIKNVDKKAYLSALSLSKYIVVTCDSTSMISEAALTGKPIYIADIPAKRNDQRFKNFRELFNKLNIIKNLNENLEIWTYNSLNETARIAEKIKKELL